ncbi:MAG TPA: hypothetical protein VFB15_13440 [Candidatus Binataceae bacterium]|nr:hypothetical protein [Candidatus Binataceae bacterium]
MQETSSNNSNFPSYNYLTMPGGEVLTATTSSGTIVPLHDILGSTVGLVNGAGSLATSYSSNCSCPRTHCSSAAAK